MMIIVVTIPKYMIVPGKGYDVAPTDCLDISNQIMYNKLPGKVLKNQA